MKYRVISASGKSVNSIGLVNTTPPSPSAGERRGVIGIHGEFPELKLLGRKELVETLRESDFIDQPIGAGCLGDIFHTVGVKDVAHHRVTIPVLAAGELEQVVFAECFRIGHGRSLLLGEPRDCGLVGQKEPGPLDEGSNAARQRAAMWGEAERAALIRRRDRSYVTHERPSARSLRGNGSHARPAVPETPKAKARDQFYMFRKKAFRITNFGCNME